MYAIVKTEFSVDKKRRHHSVYPNLFRDEATAQNKMWQMAEETAKHLNKIYYRDDIEPFEIDDEGNIFPEYDCNVVFNDDDDYKLVKGYIITEIPTSHTC